MKPSLPILPKFDGGNVDTVGHRQVKQPPALRKGGHAISGRDNDAPRSSLLPALWQAGTTTNEERQTIVRLLLERVLLTVLDASEQVRLGC
jgi:hypothetical protein